MSELFPTLAGTVTRGEVYAKLIHHLDESRNLALAMMHLLKTEDDDRSKLLAKGWYVISQVMEKQKDHIVKLAQGTIQ